MSTAADARILAPRADGAASKRARRAPSRPANRARPPLREQGTQERRQPGAALPWRAVACERHQHPEKAVVGPDRTGSPRAGGPPPPVWLLPPSQACSPVRDGREDLFGVLPRAHLVEVRCSEPLVQVARVVGASEDGVLVDERSAPSMWRRNPSSRRQDARDRSPGHRPRLGGALPRAGPGEEKPGAKGENRSLGQAGRRHQQHGPRTGNCSAKDRWRCPEEIKHGRPEMVPGICPGFACRHVPCKEAALVVARDHQGRPALWLRGSVKGSG